MSVTFIANMFSLPYQNGDQSTSKTNNFKNIAGIDIQSTVFSMVVDLPPGWHYPLTVSHLVHMK